MFNMRTYFHSVSRSTLKSIICANLVLKIKTKDILVVEVAQTHININFVKAELLLILFGQNYIKISSLK